MGRRAMIAGVVACAMLGASAQAAVTATTRAAWAKPENDAGAVNPALRLTHLTLILKRPGDRQRAFEDLLRAQVDPASPQFHHWLSPGEVGERFGAMPDAIATVSGWLREQDLQVDGVSASRTRIQFSGTAAAIGAAFSASLHSYAVEKSTRIAPASQPTIPAAIADLVEAVHGLQTVVDKPHVVDGPVVPGMTDHLCHRDHGAATGPVE